MRRILVVDDEIMVVNIVAGQLESQFDVEIYKAENAVEAMELLKRMKFSIVITDISMPAVSGLELLDFVKKNWPSCHVIIMTAYSDFQYAYHTLKYDKVDYILKIEGYESLTQVVQKHLNEIAQEEYQQECYNRIDDRRSDMASYLRARVIDQLFGREIVVKQNEFDLLQIPLNLKNPVLLAVGCFAGENLLQELPAHVFSIPDYVEKTMSLKNIQTLFQDRDGVFLWLLQQKDEQEIDNAVVYIKESFNELSDIVSFRMGIRLSLVMANKFVSVSELLDVYQQSLFLLEQNKQEGCVRMLQLGQETEHEGEVSQAFPNAQELEFLLALLRKKAEKQLVDMLTEKLSFMNSVKDMRKLLPHPSISAMEILLEEAKRLFHTADEEIDAFSHILYQTGQCISGEQWLDEALRLLKQSMQEDGSSISTMHLIAFLNKYINEHYMEALTLSYMADMLNYNPTYISRLYSEQTGRKLTDAINLRRVEAARELLVGSGMKVKDIAVKSGFYSVKHFHQVFKKYTGVSPGDYRK